MAWQWPFPAFLCIVAMNTEKLGASRSAVAERRDSAFPLLKALSPSPRKDSGKSIPEGSGGDAANGSAVVRPVSRFLCRESINANILQQSRLQIRNHIHPSKKIADVLRALAQTASPGTCD